MAISAQRGDRGGGGGGGRGSFFVEAAAGAQGGGGGELGSFFVFSPATRSLTVFVFFCLLSSVLSKAGAYLNTCLRVIPHAHTDDCSSCLNTGGMTILLTVFVLFVKPHTHVSVRPPPAPPWEGGGVGEGGLNRFVLYY